MLGLLNNFHIRGRKKKGELSKDMQNQLMVQISKAENFEDAEELFNKLYQSIIHPLWTSLANKYSPPLSFEDMQDTCQDAWIKLLESRKEYDSKSDVYSWIYVIYKNMILDKIRQIKRVDEHIADVFHNEDSEMPINAIHSNDISIENVIIQKETADLIRDAIESIEDETEKEILKRRIIFENKVEQISLEMDIPATTVYKKLKKGVSFLRVQLEHEIN